MRKIRLFIIVMILTGIFLLSPEAVRAETIGGTYTTYDKSGNAVQITQSQMTSSAGGFTSDGTYVPLIISCEELDTKVYLNSDGTVKKIVELSTGKVLIDYSNQQETTTTTPAITKDAGTTTKAAAWNKKVKKVKKSTVYKTYKGYTLANTNKRSKIKYKYGIKISWKKVSKAKGYEIQRYENAKKCWTTIKTIKKNKKKTPSYTMTNMLSGENVKLRIRAYKKVNGEKVYGKWSKTFKFTTKYAYIKNYKDGRTKTFVSKWAAEDAFVIQNQYRKEAGAKALTWSDTLYDIGLYRLRTSGFDKHENMDKDLKKYANSCGIWLNGVGSYSHQLYFGENLATGQSNAKTAMWTWKESPGHYLTLKSKDYKCGAIVAIYRGDGEVINGEEVTAGYEWIATFAEAEDFDSYWNSLK